MNDIIKNPGDSLRGIRLTDGARPTEILIRFTRKNIEEIAGLHEKEKRFLQWLRCDVLQALQVLDEPAKPKEKFATIEEKEQFPKSKKPPLGIIPEWIWKEARIAELRQAMKRRIGDDKHQAMSSGLSFVEYIISCFNDKTLMEWIKEYSKLREEMEVINFKKEKKGGD